MIIFSAHQKSKPGRCGVVNDSNIRKNFVEHITQYSCSSKVFTCRVKSASNLTLVQLDALVNINLQIYIRLYPADDKTDSKRKCQV